mmetsp:Transcript_14588/g.43833  ORF Transcript_14588/g.43833 Transcript_14588/m.43833 type:complete len:204 (-) Transcript_14588:278-889(-)
MMIQTRALVKVLSHQTTVPTTHINTVHLSDVYHAHEIYKNTGNVLVDCVQQGINSLNPVFWLLSSVTALTGHTQVVGTDEERQQLPVILHIHTFLWEALLQVADLTKHISCLSFTHTCVEMDLVLFQNQPLVRLMIHSCIQGKSRVGGASHHVRIVVTNEVENGGRVRVGSNRVHILAFLHRIGVHRKSSRDAITKCHHSLDV